jgi:hypothetical protein
MLKNVVSIAILLLLWPLGSLYAQEAFPERCLGTWEGMLRIYRYGHLKDSVDIRLTVERTENPKVWIWKTEYLSDEMPMVKDYVIRLVNSEKEKYLTDEGDGIVLEDYVFGDKMYCIFETQGAMLTSSYELRDGNLIFEVTSGTIRENNQAEVINYPVHNLQRAVLHPVVTAEK